MTVTWREDEPRLTAAGVEAAAATLPRSPWGRKGYDVAAVNALLDQVQAELVMCANEATGLREEAIRLRRRFIQRDGAGSEWLADEHEAHAMAVALVSEAQVTADRYVASAQEYSARLTEDAQERRQAMLDEAEQVLADAQAQARAAASAAMDEPVPAQADGPLRAARASDAYGRTLNKVCVGHAIAVGEALLKMLNELKTLNDSAKYEAGDETDIPAGGAR